MPDIFALTHWSWLVLGLALLVLELVVPAMFFLWLGTSAIVTAITLYFLPDLSWQVQFLLFSILSVVSIIVSRRFLTNIQGESDQPNLNRREQQYLGRVVTLVDAIDGGYGKIQIDDSQWRVSGPDLPVGEKVRITAANGSIFEVEAANS